MRTIFYGFNNEPAVMLTGVAQADHNADPAAFEGFVEYRKTVYIWKAWVEKDGYVVEFPGLRKPIVKTNGFNLGVEVAQAMKEAL